MECTEKGLARTSARRAKSSTISRAGACLGEVRTKAGQPQLHKLKNPVRAWEMETEWLIDAEARTKP
jgi:hypothetical protein